MANYAVRLELRGDPPAGDYESLHALMTEMSFVRTVVGVDSQGANKTFPLPRASYYGSSEDDCSTFETRSRSKSRRESKRKSSCS
jgi:hypothetical protein